jgi:predicted alpha-1,2-mannosidase
MRWTWPVVCCALLVACGGSSTEPEPPLPEVDDPIPLVDPRIGSGGFAYGYGSSFVGATLPHGLAKIGPDTSGPGGTLPFHHYSGYWGSGDDHVLAFSHLHMHGTGLADHGVLAFMPLKTFDPTRPRAADHKAHFAKATEVATPGRYAVTLDEVGIDVDIAATRRGAHHRYAYTGALQGHVLIDLDHVLYEGAVDDAELHVDVPAQTVTGRLHHQGQMSSSYGGYDLYFVIRSRTPITTSLVWSGDADALPGTDASGTGVGALLSFAGGEAELQVGLSFVSLAGAQANLDAELPAWDFAGTVAAGEAAWRDKLGVVKVTGGTPAERRIFYTSLYQSFLMPSIISDVDGSYVLAGAPGVQQHGDGPQLSDLSLWDTYRSLHPLYAWLAPDSALDSVRSLLAFGRAGGFPRWPLAIGETGTMLGAPSDIVIADAVARGVPGAEAVATMAWPILRAAALDEVAPPEGRGARVDTEALLQYGYVPSTTSRSVSRTTEVAHADYALGVLAAALGETADAQALDARAHSSWKALFDPATGFLRARRPDGEWAIPVDEFDPLSLEGGYAEANAWHSLWMPAIFDAEGYVTVFGTRDAVVDKLTTFFVEGKANFESQPPPTGDLSPRPYYWHGNEPDLNAVFLFAQLGRPDLTQEWVDWILRTLYSDTPEGKAGNDDGGALASWYVFATLGLYPVAGSELFVIGAPRFVNARITVGDHELAIVGEHASPANIYVQRVTLDGAELPGPTVTQTQLRQAAELRFVMGPRPGPWGMTQ